MPNNEILKSISSQSFQDFCKRSFAIFSHKQRLQTNTTDKYFVQISHSMQIPCKVGGIRQCQLRANDRASKLSLVHTRVGICQCILFFQKLFFSEWQIRVLNSSLQASETSDLTTEPTRHTCIDCVVNYKSCNSSDKVSNHSEDNNLNFISINLKYN